MEQLAALVLNGKGLKLIGMTSSSPEIQAFLDNVSAYMVLLFSHIYLMILMIFPEFRTKFEEYICLQEKEVSEIYSQLWIAVNLQ